MSLGRSGPTSLRIVDIPTQSSDHLLAPAQLQACWQKCPTILPPALPLVVLAIDGQQWRKVSRSVLRNKFPYCVASTDGIVRRR
eukprot:1325521-Pleurochrysis_carterae.AAC.1